MEAVIVGINQSWGWLGPVLCGCFGVALAALVAEVFRGTVEEMDEGD